MENAFWLKRLGVLALLFGLMAYIFIGYDTVPFHGDEADHLHKSHDFVVAIVHKRPAALQVMLPVQIDSTEHIRLLTGTTHAYLTGYALWSMGVEDSAWPRAWNYAQDVQWNIEYGRWPSERILQRGRLPHVLLTMLSIPLAFGIVWRCQMPYPCLTASIAAFLVGTHSAWLLNGRRVLQEAALVTLSLIVVLIGMSLAERFSWLKLCLLSLFSALCFAAKPTGIIAVGAVFIALAWIVIEQPKRWRLLAQLLCAGIAFVVLYICITPPIWANPPARMFLAAQMRAEVLRGQTAASPDAYANWIERFVGLIEQPFIAPLQYYESPAFDGVLDEQIRIYEASRWHGWAIPNSIAYFLTFCGMVGLIVLAYQHREPRLRIVFVWLIITPLAFLLSIPLAWQRYYLLWSVGMCLLASLGLVNILRWLNGFRYFWF
ncbi:MAG: hypothetical protein CUN55_14170 [Phototrophicales bacterium]|nr:MAG: hypothetical protein CUN55_14170 [Phototrophicales bacterium]